MTHSHPDFEQLLAFVENKLALEAEAQLRQHVEQDACQLCQTKLHQIQTLLPVLAVQERTAYPPEEVVRQALGAFHEKQSSASPLRILARLVFDSFQQPTLAAVRGAVRTRQYLYTTGEFDIDLQLAAEQDQHVMNGQILAAKESAEMPAPFVSLQNETGSYFRGIEASSQGQFTFQRIPSGSYNLIFDLENREVLVSGIEIGHDQG